jgi:methyl-accepting chemotaxis protein
MNSMSLKNKLLLLVAILLSFCLILAAVGYRSAHSIAKNYGDIANENLPKTKLMLESLAHLRLASIDLIQMALPGQTEEEIKFFKKQIEGEFVKMDEEDKAYKAIPFGEGEEALYKDVSEKEELLKKDFAKCLESQAKSGGKENAPMEEFRKCIEQEFTVHSKSYRESVDKLNELINKDTTETIAIAQAAKDSGEKLIITAIICALGIGGILSIFILKNIIADQVITAKAMSDAEKGSNMMEKSPINTMMATPEGIFTYMNQNSMNTLKSLQQYLPDKVENFIGKSIDMLHKNPEVQKRIIRDPRNLPHKALISVGPEKLNLFVTAIMDGHGNYIGPMVNWEIVTDKVNLVSNLTKASDDLAAAASNVFSISSNLSAAAEETSAQANTASVASEEVNAGVQTVASNMDEMVSAIKEITKTTNEAASMTAEAMRLAKNTNTIINKLGDSSMDIGNVIKVISSIAQQTNLLALNATIEAARAGEAGKGFAVVANEVKELANQTAKATHEITKKIETIQDDSKNAVDAIAEITIAIEKVNGFTGNIAASVEEQAATTNEVTRIISESAEGVKQINENISQVSLAAANTGKDAGQAQVAAKGVGETAELLKKYVAGLKV